MDLREINDVISRHSGASDITGGIVPAGHKGNIVYLGAAGYCRSGTESPIKH